MSENQASELPVLMVAFVTGEKVSPLGLPILRFYVNGDYYLLWEGEELLKAALISRWTSAIAMSYGLDFSPQLLVLMF